MPDNYTESVEELIARRAGYDTMREVMQKVAGKHDAPSDWDVEQIISKAISAAFELARRQIAVPRVGSMSFEQAMAAVLDGKLVTRAGWGILRALQDGGVSDLCGGYRFKEQMILDYRLDNLDGGPSGSGSLYDPTDDDLAALDWMEYQKPEYADLYDLDE